MFIKHIRIFSDAARRGHFYVKWELLVDSGVIYRQCAAVRTCCELNKCMISKEERLNFLKMVVSMARQFLKKLQNREMHYLFTLS